MATHRMNGAMQRLIEGRIAEGWTAAQINDEIERLATDPANALAGLTIPSRRTIERMVKEASPPDGAEAWAFRDATGFEGAIVLGVLAVVMERTEGRRMTISRVEAGWIARVRHAAMSLDPWWVYRVARAYVARGDEPTEDLDQLLALRPWEGDEQYVRYAALVRTDRGRPHPEGFNLAMAMARDHGLALAELVPGLLER